MESTFTDRFIHCIKVLKSQNLIPSIRQFSITIGVHPQCISDIINRKREVNADIISKAAQFYDINPNYIFLNQGEALFSIENNSNSKTEESEPIQKYSELKYIPESVIDMYAQCCQDPKFLEQLPVFQIPDLKFSRNNFRIFDMCRDHMEPTLFSGNKIICSQVEKRKWESSVKSQCVFVFVTDHDILVKRVIGYSAEEKNFQLKSDNDYYQNEKLSLAAIKEIWMITDILSSFKPTASKLRNNLHQEVDNLRTTITDQSQMIKSLNSTVEKLLKHNRQANSAR